MANRPSTRRCFLRGPPIRTMRGPRGSRKTEIAALVFVAAAHAIAGVNCKQEKLT